MALHEEVRRGKEACKGGAGQQNIQRQWSGVW